MVQQDEWITCHYDGNYMDTLGPCFSRYRRVPYIVQIDGVLCKIGVRALNISTGIRTRSLKQGRIVKHMKITNSSEVFLCNTPLTLVGSQLTPCHAHYRIIESSKRDFFCDKATDGELTNVGSSLSIVSASIKSGLSLSLWWLFMK